MGVDVGVEGEGEERYLCDSQMTLSLQRAVHGRGGGRMACVTFTTCTLGWEKLPEERGPRACVSVATCCWGVGGGGCLTLTPGCMSCIAGMRPAGHSR